MASDAHDVERNEDRIDADESEPEMRGSQLFVHHPPEHLREPEVSSAEDAEDRGHAHNQVEVAGHEVSVIEMQIERSLTEHQSRDAA